LEDEEDGVPDIEIGKTSVRELFMKDKIQYYADPKNNVIYVNEKEYDSVAERLKSKKLDEKTWELDRGSLHGKFTVIPSDKTGEELVVGEDTVAGINGYDCVPKRAGDCIKVDRTNSMKLLADIVICFQPPRTVCDGKFKPLLVDYHANSRTCQGAAVRRNRTTAICDVN